MKLSTADCQKWLIDNKLDHIKAMYSEDELNGSPQDIAYSNEIISKAANPKKWKRMAKYNVGSAIDKGDQECDQGGYGGMEYYRWPKYTGGVVRTFYLDGTDHITYNLIEVDGKIVGADDCSD